jgi:hypothetical protein
MDGGLYHSASFSLSMPGIDRIENVPALQGF